MRRPAAGPPVMDFGDEMDSVWQDGEPAPTLPAEDVDPVLAFADRWTSWDRWACSLILTGLVCLVVGYRLGELGWSPW